MYSRAAPMDVKTMKMAITEHLGIGRTLVPIHAGTESSELHIPNRGLEERSRLARIQVRPEPDTRLHFGHMIALGGLVLQHLEQVLALARTALLSLDGCPKRLPCRGACLQGSVCSL